MRHTDEGDAMLRGAEFEEAGGSRLVGRWSWRAGLVAVAGAGPAAAADAHGLVPARAR